MRGKRFLLAAGLVLAAAVTSIAVAVAGSSTPGARDFTEAPATQTQSDYAIVVFGDPPAASYTGGIPGLARTKPSRGQKLNPNSQGVQAYVAHLNDVHQTYRAYLASKAANAEVVRGYSLVANALAVKLNGTGRDVLARGPGVQNVVDDALYRPTMNVSVGLVNAPALWSAVGGRANGGAGIKVGIIDTGIDDTHKFFACKSPIQHKVFASGVAGPGPTIVFDHGTHVAGTATGCVITLTTKDGPITGTISGLAPAAQPFDYNVFPGFGAGFVAFGGSAFSHDIAEALEETVADGMDVDNMSLGGGVQGPRDFLADAVNETVDAGLVVAVAAGNSGPGDSTIESPGSAAGALTAGASTNPHFIGILVSASPSTGGTLNIGAALGDFNNFVPPITASYTVTSPANGCTAISTALSGKIALIDRGVCTFSTKIRNAQTAGAVGVLVVNNVAGDPTAMGQDGTANQPTIPAAMVSKSDGTAMKPSGTATIDGRTPQEFVTTNADIIAGFSSRGPTPFTFLIKPDVTAPGVNVYSSVFKNAFAMFQGTSMATPHLAGSAALLLQAHPGWSPADAKSALVDTAKRPVFDHVTGTNPTGVLTRGGGRIDLAAATATPLTLDPASASFGKFIGSATVAGTVAVGVRNVSGGAQSCSVGLTGPTIVTASPGSFSLANGGTTTLSVRLNGGTTLASGDFSGDVVVTCGAKTLRAPWFTRIDREGKP
jgi:minor extracellular serine protease Vpr